MPDSGQSASRERVQGYVYPECYRILAERCTKNRQSLSNAVEYFLVKGLQSEGLIDDELAARALKQPLEQSAQS